MSSISIKRPIGIKLDIIETDNYLPSIKMEVHIEMEHPTGKILYQADDIWFECTHWDNFTATLNQIANNSKGEAFLENMSSNFKVKLIRDGSSIKFNFTVQESNVSDGEASINFSSLIDDDLFNQIKSQFVEFEKWW
jgi:hypothetical protein